MIRRPPRSPLFPSPTLSRSLTADHLAIFRSVFGDAPSIPAAFIANPGAFLHHVGLNLFHTPKAVIRSEEHTSELQSHLNLVCRLLLEKKKYHSRHHTHSLRS